MSRGVIEIDYGILGSSDFDQAGALKTWILCKIGMPLLFPFVHEGEYKSRLMKKKAQKSMKENGEYGRRFMSMMSGPMGKGLAFVTKKSAENQFYSDMTTVLPDNICPKNGEIHIIYSLKMGEKYKERYLQHFKMPVIHELT